jgi:integrase
LLNRPESDSSTRSTSADIHARTRLSTRCSNVTSKDAELEYDTLDTYRGYAEKHIRPLLGAEKIGSLDAGAMDSFYAELRHCRDHCDGSRGLIDHRTPRAHDCDDRCRPHECRPLAASTIRQIHFIIRGALRRAIKWKWITVNPIVDAEPPAPPKGNPKPPSPKQAARIVNEAFKDPDWGTLIWLTMITGQRRGELCAIRWRHLELDTGLLHLERAIGQRGKTKWEKETKDHQDRRITLDPGTIELLKQLRKRRAAQASMLEVVLNEDAYVFSRVPDGSRHRLPDSIGQRYRSPARRLGITTSIHKLRHYSATELIAAGVDIRTVAGRLGHGGGGTTTLLVYSAGSPRPTSVPPAVWLRACGRGRRACPRFIPSDFEPSSPYEHVAVVLRDKILTGNPSARPAAAVDQGARRTARRGALDRSPGGAVAEHLWVGGRCERPADARPTVCGRARQCGGLRSDSASWATA